MKNRDILKNHCRYIFLASAGNFWYDDDIGDDSGVLYRIYTVVLISLYMIMTILEIMAALFGDFPKDEQSDSVTFAVSHTIVMIKILSVIVKKDLIRALNKKMVTTCELHEMDELMKKKHRTIKMNIVAYVATVYGSAAGFVFEGLRKMKSGSHFATVITYYPAFGDDSTLATSFRIGTTITLMVMLITMIVSVDSFTMMHLIMFKYKIITLRHYFQRLREDFERMLAIGDTKGAREKLTNGLIEGVVMHGQLLSICKDIDKAFGTVMAVQLCQSSGSAVSLLLQIAQSNDLTFFAQLKIIFFVIALFFLLALFLCNAGEITYQASLLADDIFYCGWHDIPPQKPPQRNLRRIVLFACAQAQRPLVMKAFKMVELTYATFLQVVRVTYSVFALFYAQNN